jgi:hypothetical protein
MTRSSWIVLALATVLGLGAETASAQFSRTETFDEGLGAFDTEFGNQSNGFEFGWSESTYAGGEPGELGGLFVRVNEPTGDLSMPRILDTASFVAPVDLNQPFSASGWMQLDDESDAAGLDVNLGFFRENNPTNERIVIRILPNGSNVWRFRMAVNGASGTRLDGPPAFDSVPLAWSFVWTPSGAGNGTGTATGSVTDGTTTLELPSPLVGANAAQIDAFGVWANSASSTDLARTQRMYFDDVTYTVPEPLASFGGAAALAVLTLRCRGARG